MIRTLRMTIAVASVLACVPEDVFAQPIQPGQPVRYVAMYPERWKQKGTSLDLIPWEGKQIVVLTTRKDLDPDVMRIFVDRLDAAGNFTQSS